MTVNKLAQQQRFRNSPEITASGEKTDQFAEWMGSCHASQSLWSNSNYCKPLITYLSRIYKQDSSKLELSLRDAEKIERHDELDLLYGLIQSFATKPSEFLFACQQVFSHKILDLR